MASDIFAFMAGERSGSRCRSPLSETFTPSLRSAFCACRPWLGAMQRCIAPSQGRQAQKALRKLGVKVSDNGLRQRDPDLSPAMNAKMSEAMSRAFAAELAEDYPKARTLYRAAVAMDAADPVPVRFLGELYR